MGLNPTSEKEDGEKDETKENQRLHLLIKSRTVSQLFPMSPGCLILLILDLIPDLFTWLLSWIFTPEKLLVGT